MERLISYRLSHLPHILLSHLSSMRNAQKCIETTNVLFVMPNTGSKNVLLAGDISTKKIRNKHTKRYCHKIHWSLVYKIRNAPR